jgi:hypothetical protein
MIPVSLESDTSLAYDIPMGPSRFSSPSDAEVVTFAMLRDGMRKKLDYKGLDNAEIENLTNYLLNFFGYQSHIIDNMLSSSDRNIFYMLEEEGLLETFMEEVYLLKGKMWRIHYWRLRVDELKKLAAREEPAKAVVPEVVNPYEVYASMPDEVWAKR